MRQLSKYAIKHDDPTSLQHAKDKAEKAKRDQIAFEPVPALSGWGYNIKAREDQKTGFCFKMECGKVVEMEGKDYESYASKMEKERRKYRRIRIRDGKERMDFGMHKCGASSILLTLPPPAWAVLGRQNQIMQKLIMQGLAEKAVVRIKEISGRPAFGGGIHFDGSRGNFQPHLHLHIPKTSATGENYEKSRFIFCDSWTASTARLDRLFFDLLTDTQRRHLKANVAKKGGKQIINIEAEKAIDEELERIFEREGLGRQYQEEIEKYRSWRKKEIGKQPTRKLVKAALQCFAAGGVWPLAYAAMDLALWRLIPRQSHKQIMASIRATQTVFKIKKSSINQAALAAIAREVRLAEIRR